MNEKKVTVNPMWVLFLGACPALGAAVLHFVPGEQPAQTSRFVYDGKTLRGAVSMGITVLAVMLLTALVIALLRRILPERAVIAATILTAALFTSAAQLVLHAVLPSVYKMLGVYLAVAAVNLLVFSRGAGSASGLCVGKVVVTGLEFLAVIAVVALLRELFGLGTVWGQEIAFLKAHAVASLQKPMGGFLVYAIVAAIVNALFPAACAAEEEPGFAGIAAGTAEGGNE